MSATEAHSASADRAVGQLDMHLEVAIIPVSDVDRSKEFYAGLGWRLDVDDAPLEGLRIVPFTPPAPGPRSRSARELLRPRKARPTGADRLGHRSGVSRSRRPWHRRE
jgi:catechol 2,3-dioxygenase-like lactoylglutathione lyase family enzyme